MFLTLTSWGIAMTLHAPLHDNYSKLQAKGAKSDSKCQNEKNVQTGRLLSEVLNNDSGDGASAQWSKEGVPSDRVLLFPGALATNGNGAVDVEAVEYEEIAYCDSCSELITGDIQKCTNCFDFDLCKSW